MTLFRRTYAVFALLVLAASPLVTRAGEGDSNDPPAFVAVADDAVAAAPPEPSATPVATPVPTPAPRASDYFITPPNPAGEPGGGAAAGIGHDRAGYSYNYSVYDARYDDTITSLDVYKPLGRATARVRPYVAANVTRDSRTSPGTSANGQPAVPVLLSDNYGTLAAGLQYTTPSGLRVFAQGGVSHTIGPVAAQPSGGDARGGVQYYHDYGPVNRPHASYGNVFASTTYYSRYADAILYAQGERIANLGGGSRPVEAFARGVITLDTKSFYYSNLAEATIGVRWRPLGLTGPTIAVEQTAGRYVRGAIRPTGTAATYADFRPTVSVGFAL